MNKNLLDRIVINYRVMGGKPIIKGTRLTVQYILKLLADGWSFTDIKTEYQGISDQDIYACILYASEVLGNTEFFPKQDENDKETLAEALLSAPVLSEEEIQNIENIGKEFTSRVFG